MVCELAANELHGQRLLRHEGWSLAPAEVGGQERLDLLPYLGAAKIEAADVEELDDAGLVDEQPVGNHVEVEEPTEDVRAIDGGRKRISGGELLRPFGVGVHGDAEEREVLLVLLEKLLPPGQLTPALSPARPHKDEEPAAEKIGQADRAATHVGQGDRWQGVPDGNWHYQLLFPRTRSAASRRAPS